MTHSASTALAGPVDDPGLVDACGESPRWICEQVWERTSNEMLAQASDVMVARPLKIFIIVVVAWLANRLARRAIRKLIEEWKQPGTAEKLGALRRKATRGFLDTTGPVNMRREQRAETLAVVVKSVTTSVIYIIAFLVVLGELDINLGPFIAGAGIVGVAVGFGAQTLVRDFLSGIFMLVEDQYGVGDIVDVGEATGEVEAINLRTTRLRDLEGTVWHVPNGEIRRVGNMSQQWARALLDVEVAYDTDLDLARQMVKEVADWVWRDSPLAPLVLEEPEIWGIQNLGADGIAIRLVVKTKPGEQWKVSRELRYRIKRRFDEVGIEIPFPQRTMWIRHDDHAARSALLGQDDGPGGVPSGSSPGTRATGDEWLDE